GADQLRAVLAEQRGEGLVRLEHGFEAADRLGSRRPLATAIGMEANVGGQHSRERGHVAAARGGEESLGQFDAAPLLYLEARPGLADMAARPRRELAAGGRVAVESPRDLFEVDPEHVVQQ